MREGDHALRRTLEFEVKGQMKKGKLKRAQKRRVVEEMIKISLSGELCQ